MASPVVRLALSALCLAVAGCGGSSTPAAAPCVQTPPAEYAYALSSQSVTMYSVDSCTGGFIPLSPAIIGTGASGIPGEQLIATPNGRYVYVANLVSNATDAATISIFVANSTTGLLTPILPTTIPTGFFPQGIGIDPTGEYLYTANSNDNTISMFFVNANTGQLAPMNPATVATGSSPLSITVDPSGRFAYAANQSDNNISMYTVNPLTGVLTPTTPATVPADQSPFGVTVDPSGKFAYVPNAYSNSNTVSQYTINQTTGVLTPNTPSYVTAGNSPVAVAIDPSGKFAYVVNRTSNTVSMFTLDPATGNLTPHGSIGTGAMPFRISFDPAGKFLYVTNEHDAASVYTLNSDGTLKSTGSTGDTAGAISIAITTIK